jgi:hypothetical protein
MTELIQARYYFTHFKHDDWKLKVFPSALNPVCLRLIFSQTLVSVAFLVDTASTVGDYACVYLVGVQILRFTNSGRVL